MVRNRGACGGAMALPARASEPRPGPNGSLSAAERGAAVRRTRLRWSGGGPRRRIRQWTDHSGQRANWRKQRWRPWSALSNVVSRNLLAAATKRDTPAGFLWALIRAPGKGLRGPLQTGGTEATRVRGRRLVPGLATWCATMLGVLRRAYNPVTFPLLGLLIRLVPWRENRLAL